MEAVDILVACKHVKAEHDEVDQVAVYLAGAEQAAEDFLNRRFYATTDALAAAVLDGTAGDDPIVINPAIVAAVLLILGHLYSNREDVVVGATVQALPQGAQSLLRPHRVGMGV